ncbi:DNA primase [Acholeplasma laidlawii]|uniref:DNA primase n=1 Tax=Acholeplasma laidlawii TaxID=2148 RepID=UPI00253FB6C7|nr:DNA primase [Acholeplasma laidlawii]
MQDNIFRKINEQTDMVALVSKYVDLTKRGKNYMGLCPFHDEKTPSFSVTPEKNIAFCFGCKKGGAPITFLAQIKNISNADAAKELAQELGIEFGETKQQHNPFKHLHDVMNDAASFYQFALKNSESGKLAYDYLANRALSDELIHHFEVGYAPDQIDSLYKMLRSKNHSVSDMMSLGLVKQNEEGHYYDVFRNRITFPIKDEHGQIIAFSGRTLNKNEKAKYINSTETPIFKKGLTLYHYFESIRPAVKQKHVILHEGFFDVFASYKAGFEASVATMGTAITSDQAKLIRRITDHVVIAYDGDNPGIKATLHAIPILKRHGLSMSILSLPNKMDPDDFVLKHGVDKYQALFNKLLDPFQFGYIYYQKDKDFKKSDDITKFKQEMKQLLVGSDPTIIDLYERRSFDELGIQLLINEHTSSLPIKQKPIDRKVVSRAERSIDIIIMDLLKQRTYLDKIRESILLTDITDPKKRELYRDLLNYYEINSDTTLNLEAFKMGYTKELELVDAYCKTTDYCNNLLIQNDNTLHEMLKHFDLYKKQLEIQTLIKKTESITDDVEMNRTLKAIDELRKQVKTNESKRYNKKIS